MSANGGRRPPLVLVLGPGRTLRVRFVRPARLRRAAGPGRRGAGYVADFKRGWLCLPDPAPGPGRELDRMLALVDAINELVLRERAGWIAFRPPMYFPWLPPPGGCTLIPSVFPDPGRPGPG